VLTPATLADVSHVVNTWRARTPIVLVVCGLSGSGKSHLAAAFSEASGLPVLNSDAVRKELAGESRETRLDGSYYSDEFDRRTYAELGRRARAAVAGGGGVLVDATFRRASDRAAFADALGEGAPQPLFVCLTAPRDTLVERVRDGGDRTSDATPEVVARQSFEPFDELPAECWTEIASDRPPNEVASEVEAWLAERRS
jgi:predicted kinase